MSTSAPIAPPAQASRRLDEPSALRLRKAVQDFEALFVGYMLKSMREAIPESKLFGDGFGADMMTSMMDAELARTMTQSRSFGLAEMLYRQLTGERAEAHVPVPVRAPSSPPAEMAPSVRQRVNAYDTIIREAADTLGVKRSLVKAVIASESAGDAAARSAKDAKGLMQLLDSTASEMGVGDIWNPRENIFGGVRYLRTMLDRFGGDTTRAVASYNAGPGAVERHDGVPPYRETREYVERVMRYLSVFEEEESNDGR
jgi:soluble lytic murein transglycosylase-like protein